MILYGQDDREINLQEKISSYNIGRHFILRKNSVDSFEAFYPINFSSNKSIETKGILYFDNIQYEDVTVRIYIEYGSLKVSVVYGDTQGEVDKVATLVLKEDVILD